MSSPDDRSPDSRVSGELERGNDGRDALWEELAHGRLDPEEEAFLKALAAEAGDENDEDRVRLAAYTPLDDAVKDRITDRLVWQARVARRRRLLAWTGGATVLAAAAAFLLVLQPGDGLPMYATEVSAGAMAERGGDAPAGTPRFSAENTVEVVLRPRERVEGVVTVATYREHDGAVEAWPVTVQTAPGGAFRLQGPADAMLPALGTWKLHVLIAREAPEDDVARGWIADADPRVHTVVVERIP